MKWQASQSLPQLLYSASQTRALDRLTIESGISGYELMQRAGYAAFSLLRYLWPRRGKLLVCCGAGNNAGDGYVLAQLAANAGYQVEVLSLVETGGLKAEARQACEAFMAAGHNICSDASAVDWSAEVIVDALLGTGLERPLTGAWAELVQRMNTSDGKVLALDITSGIHADTGEVMGIAVRADHSISFIGLNCGLFTGCAPDYAGVIHFAGLDVTEDVRTRVPAVAHRLSFDEIKQCLPVRRKTDHKGKAGRVVIAGGAAGFTGAAGMAGMAAIRSGAGLVSVVSHAHSIAAISSMGPELMVHDADDGPMLKQVCVAADAAVLGPGLGQSSWAQQLFARVVDTALPLVVDADGLNLLANNAFMRPDWVLTPHPGEAARLLGIPVAQVQQDRLTAATAIAREYGGVCVLKGAGTVIAAYETDEHDDTALSICNAGSAAMATGGMGDVLAGIIASLMAQGLTPKQAAESGVAWHAAASDNLQQQRLAVGQTASDLIKHLPLLRSQESGMHD